MKFFSAQKLIALSLVIFLSGTCCLLCCETMKAAAGRAESCPMGKAGHHCCPKSDKPNVSQTFFSNIEDAEKCCPFISKRGDLAWKPEFDLKPAAVAVKLSPALFFTAGSDLVFLKTYRSMIHNRGSTYLINCVLRI